MYQVEEKDYLLVAKYINIVNISVLIDSTAQITYQVINTEKNFVIKGGFIVLEGADYDNWSNDDSYIVQKVAEKEGLTLA